MALTGEDTIRYQMDSIELAVDSAYLTIGIVNSACSEEMSHMSSLCNNGHHVGRNIESFVGCKRSQV